MFTFVVKDDASGGALVSYGVFRQIPQPESPPEPVSQPTATNRSATARNAACRRTISPPCRPKETAEGKQQRADMRILKFSIDHAAGVCKPPQPQPQPPDPVGPVGGEESAAERKFNIE